ncbi:MAG: hypothetical protein Q7T59_00440 [Candidatus Woesebacteria bacterium]|nr:hypothetical protein [Candidatus Woesebacteria bacterium]
MSFIKDLYRHAKSGQTIFTLVELANVNPSYNGPKLNSAIKYLVKNKDLIRLSKSIYSLDNNYSKQEFANKFRVPSYVSLYTIFSETGIVFQPYTSIYLISQRSEKKKFKETTLIYRKIKNEILLNPTGINDVNGVFKASPERAICDKIYLDNDEYFDNLRNIDWEEIKRINLEVFDNNSIILKWISKNIKLI